MARINFRQGIVRHQTDTLGNPIFLNLNGNVVDLVVAPDFTTIAFIQGTSDYLYTETQSVAGAWGPFGVLDYWLYWNMNPATGIVTRGFTTIEPVQQSTPPISPTTGQMWFNITTNEWFEYNGVAFVSVLRVFACRLAGGTAIESMSIDSPKFTGTQVGLTTPARVGSLIFSTNGLPIFKEKKHFFTTEDRFLTGVPTGASLRVNSIIITGQADRPLAAYSVVQYNDFATIGPANPYAQGLRLYGIIEEDATTNEVVNFITEGMVTNPAWDWITAGASANTPVYVGNGGIIGLSPAAPNQLPVGVVTGRKEILFAPSLFPQITVIGGGGGSGATPLEIAQIAQNTIDIGTNDTDIANLQNDITQLQTDVSDNNTDITQLQTDVSDNNTDIANLQTDVSDNNTDIANLQNALTATNDVYLPFSFNGVLPDSTVVARFVVPRNITFAASAENVANVEVAPSGGAGVIEMYKNGTVLIGTITFGDASTVGVFVVNGTTSFVAGDRIELQTVAVNNMGAPTITLRLTKS